MMKTRNSLAQVSRRFLVLTLFLLTVSQLTLAERRERGVDSWRPTHYDVSITLDDQLKQLTTASAKILIRVMKGPLNLIDLDFGQLTVDSVSVGGEAARFEQFNNQLKVHLPRTARKDDEIAVVVSYHGRPADGLILAMDKAGKPSATGDNWPDRVHHWIPCLDHPSAKATVNFTVTAPAREVVIANGRLAAMRENMNTTRTWTFNESRPIPPYCMVIAVGEYAQSEAEEKTAVPLTYYVPQTDKHLAVRGFSSAPDTLQFFSETVAPFPYEKLAMIVGATRFGGMENSSAIVFSSNLFSRPLEEQPLSKRFNIRRGLVELTAHEIAHQWFGDSVAIETWSDLWLSEGFATYFAGLFVEKYEGKEAFREYMKRGAEKYLNYEKTRRAPIYDRETEDLMALLNPNNYEKGAWVLHMLRGLLGDDSFFKGIRAYYHAHEHGTASTEDLRISLERSSGMDLKQFFARWVYASGHPRYDISWSWRKVRGRGTLAIHLEQTHEGEPFLNSLPVEITTSQGVRRTTIKPDGKAHRLFLTYPTKPTGVKIDPDETILKELVVRETPVIRERTSAGTRWSSQSR